METDYSVLTQDNFQEFVYSYPKKRNAVRRKTVLLSLVLLSLYKDKRLPIPLWQAGEQDIEKYKITGIARLVKNIRHRLLKN
jgi:hypothetical protein